MLNGEGGGLSGGRYASFSLLLNGLVTNRLFVCLSALYFVALYVTPSLFRFSLILFSNRYKGVRDVAIRILRDEGHLTFLAGVQV